VLVSIFDLVPIKIFKSGVIIMNQPVIKKAILYLLGLLIGLTIGFTIFTPIVEDTALGLVIGFCLGVMTGISLQPLAKRNWL
jgi:hypothetical protein